MDQNENFGIGLTLRGEHRDYLMPHQTMIYFSCSIEEIHQTFVCLSFPFLPKGRELK